MPKTMDPKTTEDRTRRGAGPVMKRRRAKQLRQYARQHIQAQLAKLNRKEG